MNEPDKKTEGIQPAPWDAPKQQPPVPYPPQPGAYQGHASANEQPPQSPPPPQQQPPQGYPPAAPPAYGAPQQPAPNTGYLNNPGGVPAGAAQPNPNAFGTGEMGRSRTRQIPNQPPQQNPQYTAPAGGPPPYVAQQPVGVPPQGVPPQGMPPQAPGTQVYPQQQPAMPMGKPTSTFAILSLIALGVGGIAGLMTFGLASLPFFVGGAVVGYLGMRDTAEWGKKSGRKMAVGGTIANIAFLTLNVFALIGLLMFAQWGTSLAQEQNQADNDGRKFEERLRQYAEVRGSLLAGGPQWKQGYRNKTIAPGPTLQLTDLVTPTELENPIEQYELIIIDETATVTWYPEDGIPREVARYNPRANQPPDWDWE